MARPFISDRLQKLGLAESGDLAVALEDATNDMVSLAQGRFEGRLAIVSWGIRAEIARTQGELRQEISRTQAELRQEIAAFDAGLRIALSDGLSQLRRELSDTRVDVLRWSFLLGIGQVLATASLLAFMLKK